ncbi:MAG: beta-ketoacyl synthase N-terminal-like domain-containing protein, partial [Acidimicrobiales bacterium]
MTEQSSTDIAIVGMAGRFPDARNPDEFWENLRSGLESVRTYTEDELRERGVSESLLADPNYIRTGTPLADFADFDAEFFGLGPKDAAVMDPQHRQLLEVAWESLESAGHTPGAFDGDIGVFAGCGMSSYFIFNVLTNPDLVNQVGLFLLRHTGNDKDFLATRISYALNLTGPSVSVQTACSTSLVAIHQAGQSLLQFECDMALAGGVNHIASHISTVLLSQISALSPDGRCKTFDASADGYGRGEGCGMVALRRLSDALDD